MLYDVIIIGAGVIGGMLARNLSRYNLSVCLLEKENDVACGASRANSGIIHGGYDPVPGTLKAKLNTRGVELLFQAAEELQVPHRRNGSMVCAFTQEENAALEALYQRGLENKTPGMYMLTGDEARELEPNLSQAVTGALRITNAGIICPYQLTIAAIGNAMDNGVTLIRNFAVSGIVKQGDVLFVSSGSGSVVKGRYVVNCAGGYSDQIARMVGDDHFTIIPRAGEYMLLDKSVGNTVSHTLFQVPTREGKGILVSPTADGNLLLGPTAVKVDTPDSKETTQEGLAIVKTLATKTVPGIDFRQVITSFTGVRATGSTGEFILEQSKKMPGVFHAGAIESPGLTCCVSIAHYLTDLMQDAGLALQKKDNWNGHRENPHAFREMSDTEKDAFIQKNPAYGKIVCRCETISEGEILDAITRNPGAMDLDGVKRRTRSGMGRCQGGFCGPYVMELLSKTLSIPMEKVTKCGRNSYMLTGKVGE